MSGYPEKTCAIDRLVRQPALVTAVLEGRKSQQRRDGVYGYPGETFDLDGVTFRISALFRQRLGDMSWDGEHLVWVHEFERQPPLTREPDPDL